MCRLGNAAIYDMTRRSLLENVSETEKRGRERVDKTDTEEKIEKGLFSGTLTQLLLSQPGVRGESPT